MSTQSIEDTATSAQEPRTVTKCNAMCGVLIGLIPLGLLAGCIALTVVLTALARQGLFLVLPYSLSYHSLLALAEISN